MHNPLSALMEILRRVLPASADAELVEAETHLRAGIEAAVRAEVTEQVEQLRTDVLAAVRTTLSPIVGAANMAPETATAAPAAEPATPPAA
jgi:DNA-binding protein H-NS